MKKAITGFILSSLLLVSCSDFSISTISIIKDNQNNWHKKQISLVGKIHTPQKIPFLDIGVYTIDDRSGTLMCFTKGKGLPADGEELVVEGTLLVPAKSIEQLARELRLSDSDIKILNSFFKNVLGNTSFNIILIDKKRRSANFIDKIFRDLFQLIS